MARRLILGEKIALSAIIALILLLSVAIPFFVPAVNLVDPALMLVACTLLYLVARHSRLPLWAYWGVFAAFLFHGLGVLGLFATSPLGLGYDKYLHLLAGATFCLFFASWLPLEKRWQRLLAAFLCLMGLAALGEVLEFVGTFYFGINNGGLTALGAGQPYTGSPLQAYDTYFDLIFNAAGAVVGVIVALLIGEKRWAVTKKFSLKTRNHKTEK